MKRLFSLHKTFYQKHGSFDPSLIDKLYQNGKDIRNGGNVTNGYWWRCSSFGTGIYDIYIIYITLGFELVRLKIIFEAQVESFKVMDLLAHSTYLESQGRQIYHMEVDEIRVVQYQCMILYRHLIIWLRHFRLASLLRLLHKAS